MRTQKVDIGALGHPSNLPNTEGVDFAPLFAKKGKEEVKEPKAGKKKKKTGSARNRQATVIDYKTLPLRSEKEVIQLIREALDNDSILFERMRKLMMSYTRNAIDARAMYQGFIEILGEGKGESLFPLAITTLKNPQKQQELHLAYVDGLQGRAKFSSRNETLFSNCTDELSILRALNNAIATEVTKRKAVGNFSESVLSKSQVVMMQHAIDRQSNDKILDFTYLMHFGVSERGKGAITQMLERHTDSVFVSRLTTNYEDYFLKDLTDAELQTTLKYLEVCQNKLRGMVVRNEYISMAHLEQKTKEEPEESKWGALHADKRQKIPKPEDFPALSRHTPSMPKSAWGNKKPTYTKPAAEDFPSLAGASEALSSNDFPSLIQAPKRTKPPR